jgi:hypothetical protein
MEEIVGKETHFQPGFICREPMAARLVPTKCILAFLDPVFNVAAPIVYLDHLASRKPWKYLFLCSIFTYISNKL